MACSQTHFVMGDERQRLLTRNRDFIMDSVSAGVQAINDDPPVPITLTVGKTKLSTFLKAVKAFDIALLVDDVLDLTMDRFIVRPAWVSQNEAWYENEKIRIDEQVKERLKECARTQIKFNLGGGTAVWGGNRSWDIYYYGGGGTAVFSLPRLRQGIVTIHHVSSGN